MTGMAQTVAAALRVLNPAGKPVRARPVPPADAAAIRPVALKTRCG